MIQSAPPSPPSPSSNGVPPDAVPIDVPAFLQAVIDPNLSLSDLASRFGNPANLVAIATHPSIQLQLQALQQLAELRLQIAAADGRLIAIQALKKNLEDPKLDPIERRRAAALILQALNRPLRAGTSSSPSPPVSPSPASSPRRTPSPKLSPEDVVRLAVEALKENDEPLPDSGLAALHAFLNPDHALVGCGDDGLMNPTLEDLQTAPPVTLEPLLDHALARFHPADITGDVAKQAVTVYLPGAAEPVTPITLDPDAVAPHEFLLQPDVPDAHLFEFCLVRHTKGPHKGCWPIDRISTKAECEALHEDLARRARDHYADFVPTPPPDSS